MLLGFIVGCCVGAALFYLSYRIKKGSFENMGEAILHEAALEAEKKRLKLDVELKQKALEHQREWEKIDAQKASKWTAREEKLDRQIQLFEKRLQEVEKKEKELAKTNLTLQARENTLHTQEKSLLARLEQTANLTSQEAKNYLLTQFEQEIQADCAAYLLKAQKEYAEKAEQKATEIIATAINRVSISTVSDLSVTTVHLPNQEMKGRVIGREGRNIRLLEQATGMNFVIDDTPNAVVISGFDPMRKEIAKLALKDLIQDGRIHPTRIEEAVAAAEKKVKEQIEQLGHEAALQVGAYPLHPEILRLLGHLHYRYSYGQNVLAHSIEVSHLMGIMAHELKLDAKLARKIGLLHDIGKAVSHEKEGSHALVGQEIALQYGESEAVANGIACHHGEIPPSSIEASLCSAADQLSGGRPGARLEALETYLKRSAKLEALCTHFEGVEKAYALQAGRELRVIVQPEHYNDSGALLLARQIAQQIEKEMSYPGKIKITVIRETKAIEYAS